MTKILKCTILFLVAAHTAGAKLLVRVDEPTRAAKKILMKVSLKNTFGENVDSARATLFLFNDQDKMVGQSTQWIIGGTKDKPALAPNASATFNFVIPSDKPFTKTKLIFNRIILEGGKQVDPAKNFEIKKD